MFKIYIYEAQLNSNSPFISVYLHVIAQGGQLAKFVFANVALFLFAWIVHLIALLLTLNLHLGGDGR